jgi:hypothetical protein
MSDKPQIVDFGAPDRFGAHLFRVEIPASRTASVLIVEDYGYRGQEAGVPLLTPWRVCSPEAHSVSSGVPRAAADDSPTINRNWSIVCNRRWTGSASRSMAWLACQGISLLR